MSECNLEFTTKKMDGGQKKTLELEKRSKQYQKRRKT